MSTLSYSPRVQAHIETTNAGIIDISDDLVSGTLTRRENAVSTFEFELQNAQRKYDGMLLPMDKISVSFKRINWVQVFTGYLNDPPIFQAWPGTLSMTASCTLKVPQFFFWDPATTVSQEMVSKALLYGTTPSQRRLSGDDGLSKVIVEAMANVLKWDRARIHIGQVPNDWFKSLAPVLTRLGKDEALYKAIGAGAIVAGGTVGGPSTIAAGTYGSETLNATQAANASQMYSTAAAGGVTSDAGMICLVMACLDESHFHTYANSNVPSSLLIPHDAVGHDHTSVGIFQQQVGANGQGAGWGTVATCMSADGATKAFLKVFLPKAAGVATMPRSGYGALIQSVQHSAGNGSNYQAFLDPATKIVAALKAGAGVGSQTPTVNGGVPLTGPHSGGGATGTALATNAIALINAHPEGIRYDQGSRNGPKTPLAQVNTLDCSSLVDWVYYHTVGTELVPGGTNVAHQRPLSKLITVDQARWIQGAVLFVGTGHIGMSVGDGKNHVASHMAYPNVKKDTDISSIDGNGFDAGGLLPNVDYSASATSPVGQAGLRAAGVTPASTLATQLNLGALAPTGALGAGVGGSSPATSTDPFATVFNNILASPTAQTPLGDSLGGQVMLINDEPFLPWLQALVNTSMRSFCSAPNGDFIAWFPDYFGAFGLAGVMEIERIELQDFQVNWSDQKIVTHQFVLGAMGASVLNPETGTVYDDSGINDLISLAFGMTGIATMDIPEIFSLIYGETAPKGFITSFLARFGARPDKQQMTNVFHQTGAPFFMALYLFTQRWAGQFGASVPMTFMPELYPGMLMQIKDYGFQAYVTEVAHSFRMGSGGGFTTTASIVAPSNLGKSDRTDLLSLLPLAAGSASADKNLSDSSNPVVKSPTGKGRTGGAPGTKHVTGRAI